MEPASSPTNLHWSRIGIGAVSAMEFEEQQNDNMQTYRQFIPCFIIWARTQFVLGVPSRAQGVHCTNNVLKQMLRYYLFQGAVFFIHFGVKTTRHYFDTECARSQVNIANETLMDNVFFWG